MSVYPPCVAMSLTYGKRVCALYAFMEVVLETQCCLVFCHVHEGSRFQLPLSLSACRSHFECVPLPVAALHPVVRML